MSKEANKQWSEEEEKPLINNEAEEDFHISTYTSEDALQHAGYSTFNKRVIFAGLLVVFNIDLIIYTPALNVRLAQCELGLSELETTILASTLYIGYLLGSLLFASLNDRYGKRNIIIIVMNALIILDVVYYFLPLYWALLVCEFAQGVLVGGLVAIFAICIEFLPTSKRHYMMLVYFAAPIAMLYYSSTAVLTMDSGAIRKVLIVVRIPVLLITIPIFHRFVPVSPRFLITIGKSSEAEEIFERIWDTNNVEKLKGRLVRYSSKDVTRGRFFDSLRRPYMLSTIMISFLFLVEGALAMGVFFIGHNIEAACSNYAMNATADNISLSIAPTKCRMPSDREIWLMFTISLGQIPGTLVAMYLSWKVGRKRTMTIVYAVHTVTIVPLFFCSALPMINLTLLVLFAGTQASNSVLNVYVSELYPTSFRNTASSQVRTWKRVGQVASPFIPLLVKSSNVTVATSLLIVLVAMCIPFTLALPVETADQAMADVTE